MLCSTRHTLRVKNKNADGSGDYYCDSEKCDARDQSGSILPYKISSFECKFNWETYLCPTGTSSGDNSLSPSDCLIDWSCASKNIPMYKNVFANVGSATLKVEDDPLPYFVQFGKTMLYLFMSQDSNQEAQSRLHAQQML